MCQNYGGFLFLLDALASSLHILAPPSQDHRDRERKRCKKGTRNCRKEKLQLRCISLELRQVHIMCCTAGSLSNRTAQMSLQRKHLWMNETFRPGNYLFSDFNHHLAFLLNILDLCYLIYIYRLFISFLYCLHKLIHIRIYIKNAVLKNSLLLFM